MIKKIKRSLAIVIMALLVVYAFIYYPTAREPMLQIIAIIVIVKIIIWLLKGKDKKEKHPKMYDKIPTGAILVAIVVLAIVVVKLVAPTLTSFSLVGGIILAIFLGYRITKDVKKDIEEDNKYNDNIIDFRPKK